ncbi:hypothetical protein JRQ81_007334 [Phrynocephalus forsythii]|uniref:Adhesion G-protein coupled receptor G4 n=1 Tax=Phrynocephalus forsythii TaxID=171643 RepID=A0A9Q0XD91_9SAUR|nr:hypothetical protein JRQ81_007334 [Phrynocephalus forsythii]
MMQQQQWRSVVGWSPSKILCNLVIIVAALFSLTETESLRGRQLDLMGRTDKYVSLASHHHIRNLCVFTVCLDLNKTQASIGNGGAFSYDVNSSSPETENVELGLSFHQHILYAFIFGHKVELGAELPPYEMHRVCCTWDEKTSLFEVFWNATKWRSESLHHLADKCLKPNGTLIMGHQHKNQNGRPMWDHVRDPQQMAQCGEGNVVSWQGDYWSLNGTRTEPAHHQLCGGEAPITATPLRTSKPTEPTMTANFYNIQMNFSVSAKPSVDFDYYDAKKLSGSWLKKKLNNSEFDLTNHNIKTQVAVPRGTLHSRGKKDDTQYLQRYSSRSIVKTTSSQGIDKIMGNLEEILCHVGDYEEESLFMTVTNQTISHIDPGTCPRDTTKSLYKGVYTWLETTPATVTHQPCKGNAAESTSRACSISIKTEKAYWRRQNLTACRLLQDLPDNIVSFQNVTITEENAEYVADHILTLLNSSELNQKEIQVLVSKLTDISNCQEISVGLASKALEIIDAFLTKAVNVSGAQKELNSMLQLMEKISFKMDFDGRNKSIVLRRLAMALLRPDPMNFQGVAFGVTSYSSNIYPELNIRQNPFTTAVASIFLPGLLKNYLEAQSYALEDHTEIQFSFIGETSLFQDSSCSNQFLNSYVVGASIENVSVQNLTEPANIFLQHIKQNTENAPVHCVFWDFRKNSGYGGWSTSGCKKHSSGVNYTTCNCSHLTHFGVLLDVYREPVDNQILTLITYTGCGVSSIFLGLALVVYLSIDKLRGDYPSKILVNLCFALMMLNLTFLVDSWLASFKNHGLCITVAAFLHYFLLVTFTWMGLEGVHMYYALIKVFKNYPPRYILKLSIAGWGIPAVMVATVLVISPDFYGTRPVAKSITSATSFCWIKSDIVFYISTLAYFCLVFLINIGMFSTVLLQIHTMNATNPIQDWGHRFLHNWKRVASLTSLLGLTWGFAFFAKGPVRIFFLYLFAVCNTLQGFLIFVFYCLMKENVRKQCRIHFCCGKYRLNYSQWSTSATTLGCLSQKRKLSSRSLKSYATSSTSNGLRNLPGSLPDIGIQSNQICCSADFSSVTYLKAEDAWQQVLRGTAFAQPRFCTEANGSFQ